MIHSRSFDIRNGYEPGEPHYDVRHGTHLVDPLAERHGYGDREWIGMTDADRLCGRACVWNAGLSVCAGERDAWVWRKLEREDFDQIGEPVACDMIPTLWRAYFACGCESLRYRLHPSDAWTEIRALIDGRRFDATPPRGFIRRTVLSHGCALHRAMGPWPPFDPEDDAEPEEARR